MIDLSGAVSSDILTPVKPNTSYAEEQIAGTIVVAVSILNIKKSIKTRSKL